MIAVFEQAAIAGAIGFVVLTVTGLANGLWLYCLRGGRS